MAVDEQELLKDNHLLPNQAYGSCRGSLASRQSAQEPFLPVDEPDSPNERTALFSDDTAKWTQAVEAGIVHTTYAREVKVLVKYAVPLVVTFLLQYSLTVASVFSAGNIGKNELAAVSLASMTSNITGYAIFQGLSTSLDTLCPQAYGSGKKQLVGLHLQRMAYFLLVLCVPVMTLWFFAGAILRSLIPDPEPAELAGRYLRILALGAPGYALFESGKRFVQAQGIFMASTYVLVICAPLNALLNYLLVWHPTIGFGFSGAPTAVVIVDWLMPLLLFLYVRYIDGYQCWGGFSKSGLKNWWPMIKLALPGLVMVEAEFLAFEILTLLASYFSTAHLAAQSVLATACSITFQIPFALAIASSTRVANFLGATLGDSAHTAAKTGLMASAILGICNSLIIFLSRKEFAKLFTNDAEVISLVVAVMPLASAFQLWDGIASMAAGILRGQGRQYIGSYVNLVSYYIIALPLSTTLAFIYDWKLVGLWTGVALALFIVACIEAVVVMKTDWQKVVDAAHERNNTA